MPTIIRATDQNRGIQQEAFNFEDLATQAHRYMEKVRAEAAQLLAAAQQEADKLKKRAEAEGRAAGRRAIEQTVTEQLAKQLASLLPALRQAIREIHDAKQAWLTHWEKSAVGVAAAIAARVVRRELTQVPQIAVDWVREALELAAGSSHLRIHLHPDDCETLGRQAQVLAKELTATASIEIIPDPEISLGGCRIETRFGRIDQRLEAQLARIEEELT